MTKHDFKVISKLTFEEFKFTYIIQNVKHYHNGCSNEYSKKIYFELTDDPMDINAECLFAGDNVTVKVNDVQINNEESLASRMIRVQNFLEELLKIKNTIRIILDIDALNIDENLIDIIKINVKDFQSKMIDLYKLNNNWEPTVRIILIN